MQWYKVLSKRSALTLALLIQSCKHMRTMSKDASPHTRINTSHTHTQNRDRMGRGQGEVEGLGLNELLENIENKARSKF